MSKASDTFENEFLKLLFQNIAIANIGDASGLQPAATAGNLYLRLCTDAVAASDAQIGTECAYTGYVAGGVAVERSATGWTVTTNQVKNAAEVAFGACSAGSENIRYVEVWRNNTGTTEADRIAWAQLNSDVAVAAGVTPKFAAEALTFTFD
jgi:hypothetical protein